MDKLAMVVSAGVMATAQDELSSEQREQDIQMTKARLAYAQQNKENAAAAQAHQAVVAQALEKLHNSLDSAYKQFTESCDWGQYCKHEAIAKENFLNALMELV